MDRLFLLTRPKYDLGTEYLSAHASSLIKKAENLKDERKKSAKSNDHASNSLGKLRRSSFIGKKR